MSTPTSQFDYHLPEKLIAQNSVSPRDSSKMMILRKDSKEVDTTVFSSIIDHLHAGDVLVLNNSKVFKARMHGVLKKKRTMEVFLLRPYGFDWEVMMYQSRKAKVGDEIVLDGGLAAIVKEKRETGTVILSFQVDPEQVMNHADKHGEIPTPPYVEEVPGDPADYQTIYADNVGSVAAPTAGFHFTEALMQKIIKKGIEIEYVTLHVGMGTFMPMKGDFIEDHAMHCEFVSLSPETAQKINQAKQEKRRIISVGTTTVRTLEGIAKQFAEVNTNKNLVLPPDGYSGDVNLFISPGFKFRVIDALVTNFHLPKSTLLVLVAAFAGRESMFDAYKRAIEEEYRFYSFGDAMFIC